MPRRGTKRPAKPAAKLQSSPESTFENENESVAAVEENNNDGEQSAEQTAVVVHDTTKPAPQFFMTFGTKAKLEEGICVVRKLANGQYEIMSLDPSVHKGTAFGNMDFGRQVREEASGERLKMLEVVEKTWRGAEFGFGQAISSAKLRLFRFLDLPIELRYKIYDFTISSRKKIRHGNWALMADQILPGIQLRGTCRQIYDETHNFFWRNSFVLFGTREIKPILPFVKENLREVTLNLWSFRIKDKEALKMLRDCVSLETLHLRLTNYCIAPYNGQNPYTVWEYAKEPAVEKFRGMAGFRELLDLRGLTTVTVTNDYDDPNIRIPLSELSIDELKAFEAFVIKKITQPRPPKKLETLEPEAPVTSKKVVKKAGKTNTKAARKRKSGVWDSDDNDEDDDDNEGNDEYTPKPTKRSRVKK